MTAQKEKLTERRHQSKILLAATVVSALLTADYADAKSVGVRSSPSVSRSVSRSAVYSRPSTSDTSLTAMNTGLLFLVLANGSHAETTDYDIVDCVQKEYADPAWGANTTDDTRLQICELRKSIGTIKSFNSKSGK